MYSRIVKRGHTPEKCGPNVYYAVFGVANEPSGCRVMRDPYVVLTAIDAGEEVWLIDRGCGFCGGNSPCMRHY